MRTKLILFFLILVFVLVDIYVFQALKTAWDIQSIGLRYFIWGLYWLIAVAGWLGVYFLPRLFDGGSGKAKFVLITLLFGLFIGKLLVVIFLLIDDLRRGGTWLFSLFKKKQETGLTNVHGITRSQFLSRLGLLVGGGFFGILMYGLSNKYNYRIRRVKIRFPELPEAFNGLRIVQLSDIHSGSFDQPDKVQNGIEMVLAEEPDIILFTGDLVNNRSSEMKDYWKLFSRLHAPMGIYSILGNHDYGDYVDWPSKEAKAANLQELKDIQAQMGWKMLNNAHTVLKKKGQQIGLIGVENWSAKPRFPKYGDMKKATEGLPDLPFNLLMSHDPSHWDAEIRPDYPNIDLMLAGHTHGMQFGVEIPGLKWSPIQYMYPEWAGLYKKGRQYLYVNRGYGFLGYPGRVGILPEITVIELERSPVIPTGAKRNGGI